MQQWLLMLLHLRCKISEWCSFRLESSQQRYTYVNSIRLAVRGVMSIREQSSWCVTLCVHRALCIYTIV
jgi:hypothetical protein